MNLLQETLEVLKFNGYSPVTVSNDIEFIGMPSAKLSCTWEEFQELADFEYDAGFGGQEVSADLRIIFYDKSQLIRTEYDGAEEWEFISSKVPPSETRKSIRTLRHNDDFE